MELLMKFQNKKTKTTTVGGGTLADLIMSKMAAGDF
jgi:hypothetical protein